jgi:predicted negative regulator of RcsB-dependent stress response
MTEDLYQEGMQMVMRARQLEADGDPSGAEALLARAVVWDEPAVPPMAGLALAELYERQGRDDAAMSFYETVISTGYTVAGAMAASSLGDLHLRGGRTADAKEAWTKSVELVNETASPTEGQQLLAVEVQQKLDMLQRDVPPPQV